MQIQADRNGTVRICAPAKINIFLEVVGRRADGYHLLNSVVIPIALFDQLTIETAPSETPAVTIGVEQDWEIPADEDNLAVRAAALFLKRRGVKAEVRIALRKRIPVGAGLGGGSSDAAAVLRALDRLAQARTSRTTLAEWGLELGADVPFFLYGRPARMTGVGEELARVDVPIDRHHPIIVAFCGTALGTRDVYQRYDDSLTSARAASSVRRLNPGHGPLQDWLINDLEAAAFEALPNLAILKRQLRALGARGVVMTGSGSAMVGIWDRNRWDDARAAASRLRAGGTWARVTRILEQVPAVERDEQHGGRSPSW